MVFMQQPCVHRQLILTEKLTLVSITQFCFFMMIRCGLLVLTSPLTRILTCIPRVLSEATKYVQDILYIHLAPGLDSVKTQSIPPLHYIPCDSNVKKTVAQFYSQAAKHHQLLDLRVIIGNVGEKTLHPRPAVEKYHLQHPFQLLLTDAVQNDEITLVLKSYSNSYFKSSSESTDIKYLNIAVCNLADTSSLSDNAVLLKQYDNTCLGGTFDRLHTGHKILLSQAAMITKERLISGITDGAMNEKKTLHELMEPCEPRIQSVQRFLDDVKPQLLYEVVPIVDPYGPSITDGNIQCIVVSEETLGGGEAVNTKRLEKGMSKLDVDVIEIIRDEHQQPGEEAKISSSSLRQRLLGTLLKHPMTRKDLPASPYIIGLTGGIASGKSSVCKRLQGLGAAIVDCDKLGHQAYTKDGPAYSKVIAGFGDDILAPDGSINRKSLGGKVFGYPQGLQKLNDIVWPVIREMAQEQIKEYHHKGHAVVVLDAAVLLEAEWDQMTHEVWTTMIPKQEAVTRIIERNGLTEEAALKRIDSQMSNIERVSQANVVLCTLWEYHVTQLQVEKAWRLLQERIAKSAL